MALDEFLYGRVVNHFKKKKEQKIALENRTVFLADEATRLTIIASAIAGKKIEIFAAEREGGYKNENFFLPFSFGLLPEKSVNKQFYIYRTIYLACQYLLKQNWEAGERSLAESQQAALDNREEVLKLMFADFSSMDEVYHVFLTYFESNPTKQGVDYSFLYGKWMTNEAKTESNKLANINDKTKQSNTTNPTTTIKAKAVEEIKTLVVDKKAQEDYVLTHNFENVETADEFDGTWRDFDGSDELEDHQEALDELNMKLVVRVDDAAHSVYQAEFLENTNIAESEKHTDAEVCLTYDEWNYKTRSYKQGFSKLYPKKHRGLDAAYVQTTLRNNASELMSLRKMLANVNNKYQWVRRQTEGQELDLDSVTDYFVDVHSNRTPNENIYRSSRKTQKDISILLLLDVSLSSDGYVDGYKILDIEKQVALLFGEILNEYEIDFAVDCFHSKTRNYSTYLTVKDFDDDWNKAKNNIGSIEATGYTRIGTAIRHSASLLQKREAKKKWLILLSDGKPNDFDKYEGKYGINDVQQALREFKQLGLNSYALAVEATAKYYLPRMFGQNNYQIVSSPQDLIRSLVVLYEKIKYS